MNKKIFFEFCEAHFIGCSFGKEIKNPKWELSGFCRECNCGISKEEAEALEQARRLAQFNKFPCPCGCEDIDKKEEQEILDSQEYKDAIELLKKYSYDGENDCEIKDKEK